MWLVELAKKTHSEAELYGLDISLENCPPKPFCPSNIVFQEWDVRSEPPDNLMGKFDLVNIRLLVFRGGDVRDVTQRLVKLLSEISLNPILLSCVES